MTVAAFCAVAMAFGSQILSLVPTPLLGGVLIWIGVGLIRQWLIQSYARLAISEYAVIVLIFAIIDPCYSCTERMAVLDPTGKPFMTGKDLIRLSHEKTEELRRNL